MILFYIHCNNNNSCPLLNFPTKKIETNDDIHLELSRLFLLLIIKHDLLSVLFMFRGQRQTHKIFMIFEIS